MPLPTPNKGEEESKFISRCISFAVKEGMPNKQAVAACYTQWRNKNKKTRMKNGKLQMLQQLSAKLVFNADQTKHILKPLDELKADNNGLLRLPRSTLLVADGLYNNVWHPTEEAEKSYTTWDCQPFILDHEHMILAEIGFMEAPMYDTNTKKLSAIPVVNMNTAHGKDAIAHIQTRLMAGKAPETSVGFWCSESVEDVEQMDNEEYTVARDWEGDHNSLVFRGACSPSDGAGIGLQQNKNKNFDMEEKNMTNKENEQENKPDKPDGDTAKPIVIQKPTEDLKETFITREEHQKLMQDEIKKATELKLKNAEVEEFRKLMADKKYEKAEAIYKKLYPDSDGEPKTMTMENVQRLVKDEVAKAQSHRTTPTRDEVGEGKPSVEHDRNSKEYRKKQARTTKAMVDFMGKNPNERLQINSKADDYDDVPDWMVQE